MSAAMKSGSKHVDLHRLGVCEGSRGRVGRGGGETLAGAVGRRVGEAGGGLTSRSSLGTSARCTPPPPRLAPPVRAAGTCAATGSRPAPACRAPGGLRTRLFISLHILREHRSIKEHVMTHAPRGPGKRYERPGGGMPAGGTPRGGPAPARASAASRRPPRSPRRRPPERKHNARPLSATATGCCRQRNVLLQGDGAHLLLSRAHPAPLGRE